MVKPTVRIPIATVVVLALAGILFTVPGGSACQTVVANGHTATIVTTTASPTATGTPAVTLTPTFSATAAATATAMVTLTPTSAPTSIATLTARVYLPCISRIAIPTPTPTPTPTLTPTATPTPVPIQFTGKTDQNKDVTLVVRGDLSAVTELWIPVTVVCAGQAFSYSGHIPLPGGLPIINRRFTLRLVAGRSDPDTLVYDEYTGEFDSDFSTAQGTWRKWGVLDQPLCDNTGTWRVSRHASPRR